MADVFIVGGGAFFQIALCFGREWRSRFGDKGCSVLDTFNCEALRITGTGWPGLEFDSSNSCTKPFTGQHIASAKIHVFRRISHCEQN